MSDVKDAVKLEPGEWIFWDRVDQRERAGTLRPSSREGYWQSRIPVGSDVFGPAFHSDGSPLSAGGRFEIVRCANAPSPEQSRIASLEAHNAALQTELDSLLEYKRLSENDALIRRIREVCEKHDPASLELEPYAQVYAIECVLDGQAGALDDWHEFFEFAANGETALSVIERYEAWKAARKNSPVAKDMLRTMEGGAV